MSNPGRALLLFVLLREHTPGWDGSGSAQVKQQGPVTDGELAARLGVAEKTARAWRLRLRKAGVLSWWINPGRPTGFIFFLHDLGRLFPCSVSAEPEKQETAEGKSLGTLVN